MGNLKDDSQRSLGVVVADDHPLVRAGVVVALQAAGFAVLGQAADRRELLSQLDAFRPGLLLLDLELGDGAPGGVVEACRERLPQLKILVLSGHERGAYLRPLRVSCIQGFVLKDEAVENLVQAVRVVAEGGKWFSHRIQKHFAALASPDTEDPLRKLTGREREILQLMRQAKSNEEIAVALNISKMTVRRYATIIYEKLGVKSRIEAIVRLDLQPAEVEV